MWWSRHSTAPVEAFFFKLQTLVQIQLQLQCYRGNGVSLAEAQRDSVYHGTLFEKPVPSQKVDFIHIPKLLTRNLQTDLGQVTSFLLHHQRWLFRHIFIPHSIFHKDPAKFFVMITSRKWDGAFCFLIILNCLNLLQQACIPYATI